MGNMSYIDALRGINKPRGHGGAKSRQKETTHVNDLMSVEKPECAVMVRDVDFFYGANQVLHKINMDIGRNQLTSLIGPSGCGKSTLLRSMNRLNDRIPNARLKGTLLVDGVNPYIPRTDLMNLRRKVGMVFQRPNPFPMSIFDNIALGPRMHTGAKGSELTELVETSLRKAVLWDEVKDHLHKKSGMEISGGQQQRLCIARMLAVDPQVILMDEPCSALDPVSTFKIEELMVELAKDHSVIVVTHNLQQAARISHHTAFFMYGKLVEYGDAKQIFMEPVEKQTEDYISGRFG